MSVTIQTRAKSANRAARAPFGADEILLTPEQKRRIRESFLKLAPALDLVGQLYFFKLFRLDPAFRRRFGADTEMQGRKFMAAVKLGLISLNHDDGLVPIIKLLGVRYRQMGLKVRDYRTMTKALIWTLERSLETKFTPKTKEAWTVLLTQVTRILSGSDAALLRSVG
jgi:hemoglobin-like flavoprotein